MLDQNINTSNMKNTRRFQPMTIINYPPSFITSSSEFDIEGDALLAAFRSGQARLLSQPSAIFFSFGSFWLSSRNMPFSTELGLGFFADGFHLYLFSGIYFETRQLEYNMRKIAESVCSNPSQPYFY